MRQDERLIEPGASWREEFIDYCEEFKAAGEPFAHGQLPEARADFVGLVERWRRGAQEEGLAEGLVPQSIYWLVRGRRIVGTVRFRHRLNENLMHEGGHIGYEVRPSERGKGYASRMLALTLAKARQRGLTKVLLTCQKDNSASARIIQKHGGVLENEVVSRRSGKMAQRYWIALKGEDMMIRLAEAKDLARIAELWEEVAECHARIDSRFGKPAADGKEKVRKWMGEAIGKDAKEGRVLLVAEVGGEVVGALHGQMSVSPPALAGPAVGMISDLYVDEAVRRRGVGRKLVEASMRWFKEHGAEAVKMSVAVRNEGGVRFWEAMGFEVMMEMRWRGITD